MSEASKKKKLNPSYILLGKIILLQLYKILFYKSLTNDTQLRSIGFD